MPKTPSPLAVFLNRLRPALKRARQVARDLRQRLPVPVKRWLRRTTLWSANTAVGIALLFAIVVAIAHLWLPTLTDRKAEIEQYLGKAIGNPVDFDTLDTFWDGLNPGVHVQGFRVHAPASGETAVQLKGVRLALAWWPLLTGRIEIRSLLLNEPSLTLERQADGRLQVVGLGLAQTGNDTQKEFSAWLFRQRELAIANGELLWIDRKDSTHEERLTIRRVNVVLHNDGDRHRLDFRAEFPKEMCGDCRLSADVTGLPVFESDWHGEIDLTARALAVNGLPRALRAQLPAELDGELNLRVESRWRQGRPESIEGSGEARQLLLPLPAGQAPLRFRSLTSAFRWQGDAETGRIELDRLRLGLTRTPWNAGSVRFDYKPERWRMTIDHLDVGDLAAFANVAPREGRAFEWLRVAQPEGAIDRLEVELHGKLVAPTDYRVSAQLRDWRFTAHQQIPGLRGLYGTLNMTHDGGEFEIENRPLRVEVPRIFQTPRDLTQFSSTIRWRQDPEDWFVRAEDIKLAARAGRVHGDLELRIPKDPAASPVIKLRLDGADGDGTYTAEFIPLTLPEKLRAYLAKSILGGRVTQASAILHGALHNFPFRDGKGRFEIRAQVENGVYEYLPGWAPLRDIEADLYFTGKEMLITARRASLRNVKVGRLAVAIDDFRAADGAVISVQGRAVGPLDDSVQVLMDSESPGLTAWLIPGMHAEGDGVLHIDLRIPTRALPKFDLTGEYRFLGNRIKFPFRALAFENLHGMMAFTQAGLRSAKVDGRFLGGDTMLEANPATEGHTRIEARGRLSPEGLAQLLGPSLAPHLAGEVPWQAELRLQRETNEWNAAFDLGRLEISLPAPLAKVRDEPLTLALRTLPGGSRETMLVDLQAGARLNGKFAFTRSGREWTFGRGRLGVGERAGPLPSQNGLHIGMRLASLNADDWWALLRPGRDEPEGSGWSDVVTRLNADVDALEVFGRPFGRLRADVRKVQDSWIGQLDGDALAGQFTVVRKPPAHGSRTTSPNPLAIAIDLERLQLPPAGTAEARTPIDPRDLPVLTMRSKSFRSGMRDFGAIDLAARPEANGWRVEKLVFTRPEANASITGTWNVDRFGQQTSRFDLDLNSSDFGLTMEGMGYPGEAAGGKLTLDSQWSWPGAPMALLTANLSGEMSFKLSQGRMLKVEPGAGRLMGLFDIVSIPRYLTFDFSSLFGKGMVYNSIQSSLEVENGNAYTRNFVMDAAGATIDLSGRIGLATQDLDLEMGVTPKLMEELVITGGLIGGPAVGAAVALLHTLVKKPLEKSTRIPYTVHGSWQKPTVTRVGGFDETAATEP